MVSRPLFTCKRYFMGYLFVCFIPPRRALYFKVPSDLSLCNEATDEFEVKLQGNNTVAQFIPIR